MMRDGEYADPGSAAHRLEVSRVQRRFDGRGVTRRGAVQDPLHASASLLWRCGGDCLEAAVERHRARTGLLGPSLVAQAVVNRTLPQERRRRFRVDGGDLLVKRQRRTEIRTFEQNRLVVHGGRVPGIDGKRPRVIGDGRSRLLLYLGEKAKVVPGELV